MTQNKTVQTLTIVMTHKKHRVYVSCPHAVAIVTYSDGTTLVKGGYSSICCGYARISVVIADIFNDFLADLLRAKPDSDFYEKAPNGVVRYEGASWYEGGMGASAYRDVAQYIGGEFLLLQEHEEPRVYMYRALPKP